MKTIHFGNGWAFSSHSLRGMWLLIYAGIKLVRKGITGKQIWGYYDVMHQLALDRFTGLILGLGTANERRRYFVTTSLIGWGKPRISPDWVGVISASVIGCVIQSTSVLSPRESFYRCIQWVTAPRVATIQRYCMFPGHNSATEHSWYILWYIGTLYISVTGIEIAPYMSRQNYLINRVGERTTLEICWLLCY